MQPWFGMPFWIWGLLCVAVAAIYWRVWPRPAKGQRKRAAWLAGVLRYGHSLVWLLLALACGLFQFGAEVAGIVAGRAALITYLVFVGAFAYDRTRKP